MGAHSSKAPSHLALPLAGKHLASSRTKFIIPSSSQYLSSVLLQLYFYGWAYSNFTPESQKAHKTVCILTMAKLTKLASWCSEGNLHEIKQFSSKSFHES